ncbi:MAG: hypothetical protein EA353_14940 [Puniceicoccaceae bacterium]|nr:MAG: hypothetical protein EA353_14940 [Puniceicoccaceae bacterium]
MSLIARQKERQHLDKLLQSKAAEFFAIYGRRRVGKTFLIREHFKRDICFELTGLQQGKLNEQLAYFHEELERRTKTAQAVARSWPEAFNQLRQYLEQRRSTKKRVIFLDEIPWLDSHRSGFKNALDHFWNTFLSRDPRNILIISGSAASWIVKNVINDKGGLHNRITAPLMRLEPFKLDEIEAYLKACRVSLTRYDIITLAMVMGGIPMYLKDIEPGQSAAQAIKDICFGKQGRLQNEFQNLYGSLFDNPERHLDIVRELGRHPHGRTRTQLQQAYKSGGRLTRTLFELEEASFITLHEPFGGKKSGAVYRLTDEYSLFYLKWIEGKGIAGQTGFSKTESSAWRAWSGYALEALAFKHIEPIMNALKIGGIQISAHSWVHRPNTTFPQGAQVDLLLDRADRSINLIEIKFSEGPFTINKTYAEELRRKVQVFKDVTGTRKNVFLTFLTTHGLTENVYAKELVDVSITTECLFTQNL